MISDRLLAHVKKFEGFRERPYVDPVGLPTIGYGHRIPSLAVPAISETEATALLTADLDEAQRKARALCPALTGGPLDALTDLLFNVGCGPEVRASQTVAALRAGDWTTAAAKLRTWNKGRINGRLVPLAGLTLRRDAAARWIEQG